MQSGIYQIVNIKNGKSYIGSAVNLQYRWRQHKQRFKEQIASKKFQNAWNKYGEENFEFLVLEYCSCFELEEREQHWINWLGSYKNGYNTRPIANSNAGVKHKTSPMKGKKHSLETRKKLSESHKGLPGYWLGKNRSAEDKIKMSDSAKRRGSNVKKGFKPSEETRKKMSDSAKRRPPNRLGAVHSEETKKKLSVILKGKTGPNIGKKFGPMSKEHKLKISKSLRHSWENRKNAVTTICS